MTVSHLNNCIDTNRVGNGGHQAPKLTKLDVIFIYKHNRIYQRKVRYIKNRLCRLQIDAPRWPRRNTEVLLVDDKDRPLNAGILN